MQWHFEFKDWEEAFKHFYRKRCGEEIKGDNGNVLGFRAGDPELVFVVSTSPYVSGYWIEKEGAGPDAGSVIYKTVEEVQRLEQRIRHERGRTGNLSLGGVVA